MKQMDQSEASPDLWPSSARKNLKNLEENHSEGEVQLLWTDRPSTDAHPLADVASVNIQRGSTSRPTLEANVSLCRLTQKHEK